MKRVLLLCVLTTMALPATAAVHVGDKPAIDWVSTAGQKVNAASLGGNLVVIDFWATWCGPCMKEADHMVQLSKDYASKGVQILGVSLDNSAAAMAKVAAAKGFTWPQVCDGKGWKSAPAVAWGVDSIPRTFILSPEGAVVWSGHPGEIDKPLEEAIAKYPTAAGQRAAALDTVDQADKLLADKSYEEALAKLAAMPAKAQADAAVAAKLRAIGDKLKIDAADKEAFDKAVQAHPDIAKLLGKPAAKSPALAAANPPASGPARPPEAIQPANPAAQARSALAMGNNYLAAGRADLAKRLFEKVIKESPDSDEAAQAKTALDQMNK